METAELDQNAKRGSWRVQILRALVSTVLSVISLVVHAECQHETVWNFKYQMGLSSATYNAAANNITLRVQVNYLGKDRTGTSCHWTANTTATFSANIDGRSASVTRSAQGQSLGGAYTIVVPGKSANNITLSGSASKTTIYGASYSTPYVDGMNEPPTVADRSMEVLEDSVGTLLLTANDPDTGDTHTYQIVSQLNPSHGSASISGGTLVFTPAANWNGNTSLTYRAIDSAGAVSNTATVSITVEPVNDAPVAQNKSLTINEDTSGTVSVTATDIDSPAPTVFQIVTAPNAAHGTASISGSTLTFTPKPDWNGSTSLTYRAQDSSG
ncbi:TPA: cadherin-like domain-containing protein, partial [Pseudomonas aeruginosa]|nr:tandem-95 repeat protein [Pseudomonas aeruginosa]